MPDVEDINLPSLGRVTGQRTMVPTEAMAAFAWIATHALNELWSQGESTDPIDPKTCCSNCCGPCSAIATLDRAGVLDVTVTPVVDDESWWVDGKVDRAWLARVLKPSCETCAGGDDA